MEGGPTHALKLAGRKTFLNTLMPEPWRAPVVPMYLASAALLSAQQIVMHRYVQLLAVAHHSSHLQALIDRR